MSRHRIDKALVERGLCGSRTRARALVEAGKVTVDGVPVLRASVLVDATSEIRLSGFDHPYVSRGGVKLAAALDAFEGLEVAGSIAMDVGASTGGFTDCLLARGVRRVHAVDVGRGQLDPRIAADARVVQHEGVNIRSLDPEVLGERVQLIVVDCSFIALAKVLPHLPAFATRPADAVVLVKPQFELDPSKIGKGGIVRRVEDRDLALARVESAAQRLGFEVRDRCTSPIEGGDGNREFLLWLHLPEPEPEPEPNSDPDAVSP